MNSPAVPKPATVMENFSKELSGANQRAAHIVRRITELNGKLWGSAPVVADVGKDVVPAGLISALQSDLNSLHAQLEAIDAALDRIEQLV